MTQHRVHPWVFMVLILPFGVMSGYVQVTIAYMLSRAGVPVAQTAGLVATGLLPHTWKFAWAPIADTTLSRKSCRWSQHREEPPVIPLARVRRRAPDDRARLPSTSR